MEENRLTVEYVGQAISDAQTKEEKERECTGKIVRLAREIASTYREYNPDGNYLNICFLGIKNNTATALNIHNDYWQNSFKIQYGEAIYNGN
jgi:hypothetical protein|nr:MAG TPA: hypothetical protein [Caudoviricetes sp.]DAR86750.1 MAG TPA: hypothetical protein [Caudoviricetes sp.]